MKKIMTLIKHNIRVKNVDSFLVTSITEVQQVPGLKKSHYSMVSFYDGVTFLNIWL